jgi:hypothetical protein
MRVSGNKPPKMARECPTCTHGHGASRKPEGEELESSWSKSLPHSESLRAETFEQFNHDLADSEVDSSGLISPRWKKHADTSIVISLYITLAHIPVARP